MSMHSQSSSAVPPLSPKMLEAVASVESYEALLELLSAGDPELAAERFLWLRTKVQRFFAWRGSRDSDGLADEVLRRLARRTAEGAVREASELPGYALGIARRVLSESLRWQSRRVRDLAALAHQEKSPRSNGKLLEAALDRVEDCLATLSREEQHLLLSYYDGEGGERIRARKQLAERLGIPMNALRLRIFRIRRRLEKCLRRLASVTESSEGEHERGEP